MTQLSSAESSRAVVERVIPLKNPPALIGYYLGVFSLIPCIALLLGPAAIVLGIIGLRKLKGSPELPGKAHAITALVLGSITTLANYGFIIGPFLVAAF